MPIRKMCSRHTLAASFLAIIFLLYPPASVQAEESFDNVPPSCSIEFSGSGTITATIRAGDSSKITEVTKDGTIVTTTPAVPAATVSYPSSGTWAPTADSTFTATARHDTTGNSTTCTNTYAYSCPAAFDCTSLGCHVNDVTGKSDGACGTKTCYGNAPAAAAEPACHTSPITVPDGSCGTTSYTANCSSPNYCNNNVCTAPATPTISGTVFYDFNHDGVINGNATEGYDRGFPFTGLGLSDFLKNSNFTDWTSGPGLTDLNGDGVGDAADVKSPDNWTITDPSNPTEPNDGYSHAGGGEEARSGSSLGRYPYGAGTWVFEYQNAPVRPSHWYLLTGYVYFRTADQYRGHINEDWNQPIDTTKGAKACIFDECSFIQMVTGDPGADNGWRQVGISFFSGSNTALKIKLGANIGAAFFDDFVLSEFTSVPLSGSYSFEDLTYDTYTITMYDNPGFTSQYYGSLPNPVTVTLTPEAMTAARDFTVTPLYTVKGNVFNDNNSNRIKDASDTKYPDPNLPFQKDQPPATVILGNLLYNPSFENWTITTAPDGWIMDPPQDYSRAETTTIHDRLRSWLRASYGLGPGAYVGGHQDIAVKPQTNYRLSGWVNSSAIEWWRSVPGGSIDVRTRLCARTASDTDIQCGENFNGGWQQISVNFNSGDNTKIRVYFEDNNSQVTYWDDFELSEKQSTDTNGDYIFPQSVISGSYLANFNPKKVLYSTTETGTFTDSNPSLNINEANNPEIPLPGRTQYLYALVVPAPAPDPPSIAPQAGVTDPSCLTASENGSRITISWTNNAIPVSYVDISTDQNFTTYYHRAVSGSANTASSTDGAGFNGYQGVTGTLIYSPGTTYYVRLWNDSANGSSASFSFPACIPTLTAYCTFSPASINTNEAVTWWAHPTPPDDGTYSYSWSGTAITDGQPHPTSSMTQPYSSSGSYSARVQVTSGSQSITTDTCTTLDSFGQPIIDPANGLPINLKVTDAVRPWIQTTGDVHSNTSINAPGGP